MKDYDANDINKQFCKRHFTPPSDLVFRLRSEKDPVSN